MTPAEYNFIIQVVNENAYERRIFLAIRADLECCGFDIRRIPYEHYLWLREERLRVGYTSSAIREIDSYEQPVSMDSPRIPEYVRNGEEKQKRARLSREEKRPIFGTLLVAGVMVAIGFMIPSISLIIWGFAFCVLLWGFKDDLPYPENYDADYVQRYVKAQEDARLYTRALIHQAYLHSGELKILNEKINGKK
ncbi:MAG: hypothetical protein II969_15500 [Anaerolineaceae bacterium]|nr:hypothetical protein [Anaerolineaceae bacterium]